MGLASFNRARRSRLQVEKLEAERFEADNKARWAAHHTREKLRRQRDEKTLDKIRAAEQDAREEIGRKTVEGIEAGEKGGIVDGPLRRDHAAEIAGRAVEDPQGPPKSATERLEARIPSGTASEKLVDHTQVDKDGPPASLVRAAQVETAPEGEKKDVERQLKADARRTEDIRREVLEKRDARIAEQNAEVAELPAAGTSAGPGKTETESSAAPSADKSGKAAEKAEAKTDTKAEAKTDEKIGGSESKK